MCERCSHLCFGCSGMFPTTARFCHLSPCFRRMDTTSIGGRCSFNRFRGMLQPQTSFTTICEICEGVAQFTQFSDPMLFRFYVPFRIQT